MAEKNYPEAIYECPDGGILTPRQRRTGSGRVRRHAYDLGFQDGSASRDPLGGWSSLTEAIKAGERIDWEQLDGLEAKCVHPELGTLTRRLVRRKHFSEEAANGWCQSGKNTVWEAALPSGWYGLDGWSLYIKGDLPLRKLTADQLEPGTCFKGSHPDFYAGDPFNCVVVDQAHGMPKMVLFANAITNQVASAVEVLEVYGIGTFEKVEEEA